MYDYGTLKPVKTILRRGRRRKRENNGEEEPNWVMLYTYMEISQ
jgi:hypothetical protein